MDKIYLSVVLATYNDERYIKESVMSILNQTYPYFELIIVNDGSTDSTADIIKGIKDERIVFVDKPNTGLADSLNVGISLAKYEWIARMDGDDIAFPERFERQVAQIDDNTDIIGTSAISIDAKSGKELSLLLMKATKREILRNLKLGKPVFVHPTVLIRKSLLDKLKGYDRNFRKAQDTDLWFRMSSCCGDMKNITEPLLYYRVCKRERQPDGVIQNLFISYWKYINHDCLPISEDRYTELRRRVENMLSYKIMRIAGSYIDKEGHFAMTCLYKFLYLIFPKTVYFYRYRKN